MPKIKLTYFNIEAVAEKVRLALVLTGTEFEDNRIDFQQWGELKPKTIYGQLPIMLLPDGTEVAQSMAMLRWVGRSNESLYGGSLYPQDIQGAFAVDEAIEMIGDISRSFQPCIYLGMRPQIYGYPEGDAFPPEEKSALVKRMREQWVEKELPNFMKFLTQKLEKTGAFLCGDKPTLADCVAIPQLRYFALGVADHISKDVLNAYPVVTAYIKRFEDLKEVAAWYGEKKSF